MSEPNAQRTVSEINAMVRGLVEVETIGHPFWVGGIVKNYYKSDLGHIYFTLVDDRKSIKCMLANKMQGNLDFEIRTGLEIEIFGDVQVYEERAEIQIQVQQAKLINANELPTNSIIDQLKDEGRYPYTPRPLPDQIRKIGLITSKSSRALNDFENTYREENGLAPIHFQPVLLEGERAVTTIIDAIKVLDFQPEIDIILLTRGGGRSSELATFDAIQLARAIIQAKTYIITGIGHYTDETVADRVADYVTSTPTAAATHIARLTHQVAAKQREAVAQQVESNKTPSVNAILLLVSGFLFIAVVILLIMNFQ